MRKKALIIVLGTLVLIIAGVVLFEKTQGSKFSNNLSDRSKEFIENQKLAGNIKYAPLVEEEKEDFKGQRISVDDCFSFVMPYSVYNSRIEGKCSGYYAFDRPRGSIVAYLEDAPSPGIDQAPGVSMRRQDSDKYEERKINVGDIEYIGFVDKTNPFSITVYRNISNKYFIFTLKLSEESREELVNILSSLEFNI